MPGLVALAVCPEQGKSCSSISPHSEAFNFLSPVANGALINCTSIYGTCMFVNVHPSFFSVARNSITICWNVVTLHSQNQDNPNLNCCKFHSFIFTIS